MLEISTDLETLDLKPTSYIASIGAVAFDINTGITVSEFYAVIGFNDDTQNSRTKSVATIEWWSRQSYEAFNELQKVNCLGLQDALVCLSDWLKPLGEVTAWGNGSIFDVAILEHAFNYNAPWHFKNVGDIVTLLRKAKSKGYVKPEFKGVKHSALDDARHQAKIIYEAWNYE